jgi:TolB-like protein/Tfp pilus assembly protein PilF
MAAESPQPRAELEERRADLLEGWKSIAEYLGKTERTVQRWEKSRGLPARRLRAESPDEQPRVYGYKSELDAWWNRQTGLDEDSKADIALVPPAQESDPSSQQKSAIKSRLRRFSLLLAVFLLGVVVAAGVLRIFFWARVRDAFWPSRARVVLAVRPFSNLSNDPAQDYIAEGLTDEMVSRLGQLHPQKMSVIHLTPTYATAGAERLGKDIQADYILAGSVRRQDDRIAVAAQLVQVSNQAVVWGRSYEGDVKDLLQVESEVVGAIAGEVLNKLPHDTAAPRQVNRDAYLYYLKGRYFWNKRTPQNFLTAIDFFQKSIDTDPTYAPPYAGLADSYELLGSAPYSALPPREAFPKAEAAARKALALDDTLAEAHVSLGYSYLVYEWNPTEAEKEFSRALALRPDYATGHQFYAYYLTAIGKLDEAIAERKKATELDPLDPLLSSALGEAYYQNRQFDLTVEQNAKSLELDPSYAVALVNTGRAFQQKGMHREARAVFQRLLAASPDNPALLAMTGYGDAISGEKSEAEKIISRLKQLSRQTYVPSVYTALVYTGLGDKNHAFEWLDKAYAERCEYLVYLPTEPIADPLRNDSRFDALLKRVGLAPVPLPAGTGSP